VRKDEDSMSKRVLILIGVLALIAAACGGAATPSEGEVVIDLTEYEFAPNSIELVVGQQVTFVLSNVGEKDHEFMIGRTVNTEPGYPNGFDHDFFETTDPVVDPMDALEGMGDMDMGDMDMGADTTMDDMDMGADTTMGDMDMEEDEHAGHTGFMVVRQPGEEATVTFTPTADSVGEWEIGCFEDEGAHWDDGMQGTLTVVEG
jgi:uncharacterized cupredoxin-like copper-binding protein